MFLYLLLSVHKNFRIRCTLWIKTSLSEHVGIFYFAITSVHTQGVDTFLKIEMSPSQIIYMHHGLWTSISSSTVGSAGAVVGSSNTQSSSPTFSQYCIHWEIFSWAYSKMKGYLLFPTHPQPSHHLRSWDIGQAGKFRRGIRILHGPGLFELSILPNFELIRFVTTCPYCYLFVLLKNSEEVGHTLTVGWNISANSARSGVEPVSVILKHILSLFVVWYVLLYTFIFAIFLNYLVDCVECRRVAEDSCKLFVIFICFFALKR